MQTKIIDHSDLLKSVQELLDKTTLDDLENNLEEIMAILRNQPIDVVLKVFEQIITRLIHAEDSANKLAALYAIKIHQCELVGRQWNALRTQAEEAIRAQDFSAIAYVIRQVFELEGVVTVSESCIITLGEYGELKFSELPQTVDSKIQAYFLANIFDWVDEILQLSGPFGISQNHRVINLDGPEQQQLILQYISDGRQIRQIIAVLANKPQEQEKPVINHLSYLSTLAELWVQLQSAG